MTGFEKGGVSPIGMKDPIPVILAESVTKLEVNRERERKDEMSN
jgi:prolyl-tRNA editing enzyme YbaK/EbsC (Cys-tRNA(Pro) deacylase)